jgi:hypothetical protein
MKKAWEIKFERAYKQVKPCLVIILLLFPTFSLADRLGDVQDSLDTLIDAQRDREHQVMMDRLYEQIDKSPPRNSQIPQTARPSYSSAENEPFNYARDAIRRNQDLKNLGVFNGDNYYLWSNSIRTTHKSSLLFSSEFSTAIIYSISDHLGGNRGIFHTGSAYALTYSSPRPYNDAIYTVTFNCDNSSWRLSEVTYYDIPGNKLQTFGARSSYRADEYIKIANNQLILQKAIKLSCGK